MYKILKTFRGSPDGCRVLSYYEGDTLSVSVDFPQDLIDVALVEKWAQKVKPPVKKKAVRRKK